MKAIISLPVILFLLSACGKSSDSSSYTYKVRFVVTGDSVTQFTISLNAYDNTVSTPFSGMKDTTIYVQFGANLRLDAKAIDSNLVGSIYVNDVLKATATDKDSDGNGKTEVKTGYSIHTP